MNDEVLIVEEGKSLPLASLEALVRCRHVHPEAIHFASVNGIGAAVISAKDEARALSWANELRAANPALPLLFVTQQRDFDLALLKANGYGPIQVLYAYAEDADELLHRVQSLLHPEYPASNQRIAIVLPVYNEAARFENVRNFTAKLRDKLGQAYPHITLFFVNDGSQDMTQDLVEQVIADDAANAQAIHSHSPLATCKLEYHSRKAGTYIQGIKSIRANVIIFADADDSFAVEDIAAMINILQDGYWDMVIGTTGITAENRTVVRKVMSFIQRVLTKPLLPKGVIDSQNGLKALSGTAATHILPFLYETNGRAIDLEMVHIARRLNFRVLQIPVHCTDRGGSHAGLVQDGLTFLRSVFTIWAAHRAVSYKAANQLRTPESQHA